MCVNCFECICMQMICGKMLHGAQQKPETMISGPH